MAQSLQQLSGAANVASTEGAEPARRPWSEALISYAQSFEDVLLQRAFANVAKGFYVDIGAFSPIAGSITKIFYDRGWSGINIEPGSIFETLRHERPRDINLNIAILDHAGMVEFLEDEGDPALSHIKGPADPQPGADRHRVRNIRCERLDHVLAEHAAGRLINFIKIDAEGAEELIIRSTDWRKIRPQVLVIEAVAPWTNDLVSQGWEPALLSAGYTRAYFDGINLFFVAEEHADLLRHFDRPVNAVDLFERYDPLKDKAVAILAAFNLLSLGVATRLDRVSARTRGVPEGTAAHVEPSIPQLVREFDAALTLVSRFDGAAQQLSQLLQKRHDMMVFGLRSSSGATQARLPNPDPDQLLRELDGAIAAAIRCERIVMRLEDPGGPRSLRVGLALAQVIRKLGGRASQTPIPVPPPYPAGGIRTKLGFVSRMARRALSRVGRMILGFGRSLSLPVARRMRAFMLEPLLPVVENSDAVRREIEAVRHLLHAVRAEAQLSPQLVQSIEALLLTMAARSSRE
jgi:FkbM family methyltransferase